MRFFAKNLSFVYCLHFDWADTPNSLKHASLKEQLKNIEKENNTGFFSNLKDFIMNFGDINPEEIYF